MNKRIVASPLIATLIAVSIAMLSTPAMAAQAPELDMLATFGSLALVIGLILGLAWLMRRMQLPAMRSHKDLAVLRQIPIGTKERIAVIKAGDEQFLVGITTQSINLISKLDKPISESKGREATSSEDKSSASSPSDNRFAKQLSKLLKNETK